MPKKKEVVKEEPVEPEVACPVCGKPVSMDVNSCPHCGAEFEEEVEEVEAAPAKAAAVEEDETAECPVCGKSVSLNVSACPYCGAEFEEDEVEEVEAAPAKAAAVEEDETAECPVCGKSVSLNVSACPYCGAEFEEDEVEEVIEVEEREVPVKATPMASQMPKRAPQKIPAAEEEYVEDEVAVEETHAGEPVLANITDFRVIGVALIILGIIGSQVALMVDWYWSWVPPIKSNLGMFVAIPAIIIVVSLLVSMLIKKMSTEGKSFPKMMPGMSLSIFMFGILALVLVMLWSPINNALQDSKAGVGGAFVAILVVGVLVMFMGQKMAAKNAA